MSRQPKYDAEFITYFENITIALYQKYTTKQLPTIQHIVHDYIMNAPRLKSMWLEVDSTIGKSAYGGNSFSQKYFKQFYVNPIKRVQKMTIQQQMTNVLKNMELDDIQTTYFIEGSSDNCSSNFKMLSNVAIELVDQIEILDQLCDNNTCE